MSNLDADHVDRYLQRIAIDPASVAEPSAANLTRLQLAHLHHVPFENLDIHRGRTIRLDRDHVYRKVVERQRGGYCYELNGLFAALLSAVGYKVELLAARVAGDDGYGPEFDHLALAVTVPVDGSRWLVDVGFGDAFDEPLALVDGSISKQGRSAHRLRVDDGEWIYERDRGRGWVAEYAFSDRPRDLAEFADRNEQQQSSPESHFVTNEICSQLTPSGRVTLSRDRLIETATDGTRQETPIGREDHGALLVERFGLDLPRQARLADIDPAILANRNAVLATNGSDGRPQLTIVWFVVDGDALLVATTAATAKIANLRADARCSVLIHDPQTANYYAEIRGIAAVIDDPDMTLAQRVGARYETDMRTFAGPDAGWVSLRIAPVRINLTDARD